MSGASLIAIDWGTTSARAYRLDARGGVADERAAPLGIAQIPSGRYDEALSALLGEWSREPAPRLACGMIGSRQGWIEAPYVACPASIDALVGGIVAVRASMLSIVPGLITRDRHGTPDVMRGEETQLVGAVDVDESMVLAVLPGTHSKWARMERGRIVDFSTYMTGELFGVLLAHSILGRMSERSPDAHTGAGFLRGVDRGLKNDGVMHAIFGARTLVLAGEMAATDVDDWLSGMLIGAEIRAALAWARDAGIETTRVRIIGNDKLAARYATALAHAGVSTAQGDRHAAARGLWRIATQAGLLH
ncbi:MAG TPA: 2-dehydro-3-deoxygalactonokinase [Casimicrobiaceae bacterium]